MLVVFSESNYNYNIIIPQLPIKILLRVILHLFHRLWSFSEKTEVEHGSKNKTYKTKYQKRFSFPDTKEGYQ